MQGKIEIKNGTYTEYVSILISIFPHPALIPAALALRGVREKPARLES